VGELIEKLGIDWKLLVANIVTFLIVLWVLRRFAFKPILKVLDDRRALAAKTVDQEKASREALAGAEAQHKEVVAQARREAGDVLVAARADAEALKQRMLDEAKVEANKIAADMRVELKRDRDAMLAGARKDLADLVVAAAGSLVEKKAGSAFDTQAVDEAIKHITPKS